MAKGDKKKTAVTKAAGEAGAKAPPNKAKTAEAARANPEDTMAQCVALCQEQRWREAVRVAMRMRDKAQRDGNSEMAESLSGALRKLTFSLRRQMAAALANSAKDLLQKEYLLDVGE